MTNLGNGLAAANHNEEALSVREAHLATLLRLDTSKEDILIMQTNLANSYQKLGRLEEAMCTRRDMYSGWLKLKGEEHRDTLAAAINYGSSLMTLKRFKEAKALLRKTMPVAQRVLGESHEVTLKLLWIHVEMVYKDDSATLANLRKAVNTLEDAARTARRVLGGAHPSTMGLETSLRNARAILAARDGDVKSIREAVAAMTHTS